LVRDKVLKERPSFTPGGDEYIIYEFSGNDDNPKFNLLESNEIELIDNVLIELQGLGAKALTKIAYATEPMKKLGATMNNSKGLNKVINFDV
jgi:hypothetical protein